MAKKASFEIYEGFTKRKKKYLVFPDWIILNVEEFKECTQFFHCSKWNLKVACGYIFKNELYLGSPNYRTEPEAKLVTTVTYIK